MRMAVQKIPCALATATDGRWMGCKECPRCVLLHEIYETNWVDAVDRRMGPMPWNAGIKPAKLTK